MEKYGSVYTPDNLADFASFIILSQIKADGASCSTILDPAFGEKLINKLRRNNFIAENAFSFSRGIENETK